MAEKTFTYTKETLIQKLKEIRAAGWVESARHGNAGGVGNTLEDLLGIEENNLPIPNAAKWCGDYALLRQLELPGLP